MAELLLVLDCEEIPARMQESAGQDLARLVSEAMAPLSPRKVTPFWGARRIGLSLQIDEQIAESTQSERGPRESAPEQALAGFLRKHGAERDALVLENGFWCSIARCPPSAPRSRLPKPSRPCSGVFPGRNPCAGAMAAPLPGYARCAA